MAFRSAISQLFSADIGMMSLDEPTAGMDEANVRHLSESLATYSAKIRDRRQVFIITHSQQLREACDQVVDIEHPVAA